MASPSAPRRDRRPRAVAPPPPPSGEVGTLDALRAKSRRPAVGAPEPAGWWDRLSPMAQIGIALGFGALLVLLFLAPMVFKGLVPPAGDQAQATANGAFMSAWKLKTGQQALWAPNVFSGMPGFMIGVPAQVPQGNVFVDAVGALVGWQAAYLLLMLVGAYWVGVRLGLDKLSSLVAGWTYALSTYFVILIEVGHNSKLRTLAFLPWVFLAVHYLLTQRTLLNRALGTLAVAVAVSLQLRENHPQISYYTALMLGLYVLVVLVSSWRDGTFKPTLINAVLLAVGAGLALALVAQPYLANYEYTRYTIRGQPAAIPDPKLDTATGLDLGYALTWSLYPLEVLTFIVPRLFGGGGQLYWSEQAFTAGPMYLGAVSVFLAAVAVSLRRTRLVWAMLLITIMAVLLSFGKYFMALSGPMLHYFPLFNKFRVPSMILVLTSFTTSVLAGLGLYWAAVTARRGEGRLTAAVAARRVLIVAGAFVGLGVLLLLVKSTFAFMSSGEQGQLAGYLQQYGEGARQDIMNQSGLSGLIRQRQAMYSVDVLRMIGLVGLAGGLLWLGLRGSISGWLVRVGIVLLVVIDLWTAASGYLQPATAANPGGLVPKAQFVQSALGETAGDKFMAADPEPHRVFPAGNLGNKARFTAHNESLQGYHGAKLRNYQDLLDQALYSPEGGLNWSTLDLLNAKYIALPAGQDGQVMETSPDPEHLDVAFVDRAAGETIFRNRGVLPRAFFIGRVEQQPGKEAGVRRLSDPAFDPHTTAFTYEKLPQSITPDSTATVQITDRGVQSMSLTTTAARPAFLVLSEIYYPAGWTMTVDGKPTTIYQTDHVLRGVVVPAGTHKLEMNFAPTSYTTGLLVTRISTILVYGGLLALAVLLVVRRRRRPVGEPAPVA